MQIPTQQSESHTEWHGRLLRRLAVVVNEHWTYSIRLAAIKAVQSMLPDGNPLKQENPENLLDRALPAWGTRLYLEGGRRITRRVCRPPVSLRDVWS